MRADKFLKTTRLLKRRALAQELCEKGFVKIGDRVAKPSSDVKPGDVLTISIGRKLIRVEVIGIPEGNVTKESAEKYYSVVSESPAFQGRDE